MMVLKNFKNSVVLKPSIIFGKGDNFFGQFAKMSKFMPFLPVVGPNVRFQPVYVGDLSKFLIKQDNAFTEIETHSANEREREIASRDPSHYSDWLFHSENIEGHRCRHPRSPRLGGLSTNFQMAKRYVQRYTIVFIINDICRAVNSWSKTTKNFAVQAPVEANVANANLVLGGFAPTVIL